jgi:hypothetical protein
MAAVARPPIFLDTVEERHGHHAIAFIVRSPAPRQRRAPERPPPLLLRLMTTRGGSTVVAASDPDRRLNINSPRTGLAYLAYLKPTMNCPCAVSPCALKRRKT